MADIERANVIAAKITKKAEETLAPLVWEMTKWPAEFRAIMWGAIADMALMMKIDAETSVTAGQSEK